MPVAPLDPTQLDDLLARTAATLDIPDFVYEDASLKYDDIAAWLAAEDSDLKSLSPEVYPQGSFRIGTVIRPVGEKGEFDIDLVCRLELSKEQTSQSALKRRIGDRIAKRSDLAKRMEEKRRCWRLRYPAEKALPDFHMDILPAIPNPSLPPTGLLITDRELVRWQDTNPVAYSKWFFERMRVVFSQKQLAVAKSLKLNVEDVPEWKVKTPLQVTIQLLKRHRDIYFRSRLSVKPSSILVTTLSALSYANQPEILDTMVRLAEKLPSFLQKRDGQWWLANPVDAKENFADGWNDNKSLAEAFTQWIGRLREDVLEISRQPSIERATILLGTLLGESPAYAAGAQLGVRVAPIVPQVLLEPVVPDLATTSHTQLPPWPMRLTYKSQIRGSVHRTKTSRKLWDLTGRPVPKEAWLCFQVNTNATGPYTVKWQVVNTGAEALRANQLRGGFYESEPPGTASRWETTSYLGTHWIEAFIIKDDVCVSRSSKKIVRVRD